MVDWWRLLIIVCTVLAVFVVQMVLTIIVVWAERRIAAWMQYRVGPNRAGPFGLLQTVADGLKLVVKETFRPRKADRIVFDLAPMLSVVPAFLAFVIVPFGPGFCIGGGTSADCAAGYFVDMQIADLNIGILWLLAMSSIAVYSAMMAGWSSGSKYPLLGGVRASAQVISYELVLSLSILPVILLAGTLSTEGIVAAQSTYRWYFVPLIIPMIIFYISAIAETNRPPFDLVEAESELVGGFHTEYAGQRFMMFFLAEYINMVTFSAVTVTLFLGGWNGPMFGPSWLFPILGFVWFFLKTIALVFLFIWIRVTLPRIRYDQLMTFGWKVGLPISIVYLMIVALVVALVSDTDRDIWYFSARMLGAGR